MNDIIIPYDEALKYLDEADVLLFKAKPFPSVGSAITKYTGGIHSHVGLLHWDGSEPYCVEQREFKGGRSVHLKGQVEQHVNRIDVYRVSRHIYKPNVRRNGKFDVSWLKSTFGRARASEITKIALEMTGNKYGWRNIWEIFKCYAPGFRLFRNAKPDNEISTAYVCSTLVTYSYRKTYADPCPNLSDSRTSPADIAQSALFHYIFTIGE